MAGALVVSVNGVGAARRRRRMARHPAPTFVFADLVGYAALTERDGDEAAARVAGEFGRAMSALSREHGAWQVKSMGDGVMIWAADATRAVSLIASAVNDVGTRPDLLPVRAGAHTGPAVMHGEDWYGSAVNVAARLARAAGPNEALLSGATRRAAETADHRFGLQAGGELQLRGLTHPVAIWRLTPPPVRSVPFTPSERIHPRVASDMR